MSGKSYEALKERVEYLYDQLNHGIEYDEENNVYVLLWTEKQLSDAKKEAEELFNFFALHEDGE